MTPDNDLALRLSAIHQERLRLDDDEAEVVREALAQAHGIVSRAAATLGLSRNTLWRLVRPGVLPTFGIPCAVLGDERRVLSSRGVGRALRMGRGSRQRGEGGAQLPFFLSAKNLKPFISEDLRVALERPILYRGNGGLSYGIEADVMPQIFSVWVRAKDAGVLKKQQGQIAVAFRVARLTGVSIDDLLAGKYPPPGTCPHCGHSAD
jgi:hypothetical protein